MSEKYYRFPCGCEFPILKDEVRLNGIPPISMDFDKPNLNCPAAWGLYAKGLNKGLWQLESQLGRQWMKRLKPENLEHLSALTALLRPGCMESRDDRGVNMTENYCRRKNKEEAVEYFHPKLESILKLTYGILTYQEQSMFIARQLAAFTLNEADDLRKGLGKKLPEVVAKSEKLFIDKAKQAGILTDDEAKQIIEWIKKGQRYIFNASHSATYGGLSYLTAYAKAHFPVDFYTSYLTMAETKDEVKEFVEEIKLINIPVVLPDLRRMKFNFTTDSVSIYFGLGNIKGIGKSCVQKIKDAFIDCDFDNMSWYCILSQKLPKLSKTICENLIKGGALDYLKISRSQMLYEYDLFSKVNVRELEFILKGGFESLKTGLKQLAENGCATYKRADIIKGVISALNHPPTELIDTFGWISSIEKQLLGINLSCSEIDDKDTSQADTTCKEYVLGKRAERYRLAVQIKASREHTISKGRSTGLPMAFLELEDSSGILKECVCFNEAYQQFRDYLVEGNNVYIEGERSNKGSLVVLQVLPL